MPRRARVGADTADLANHSGSLADVFACLGRCVFGEGSRRCDHRQQRAGKTAK